MTDSKLASLLLLNIAAAWGCTTIHVPSMDGPIVIARTMELAGLVVNPPKAGKGLQLGHRPHPDSDKDPNLPWTVSMHRQGEKVGKDISSLCKLCDGWTTDYGYVSVDVASSVTEKLGLSAEATDLATDGINEAGLTVSPSHTSHLPPTSLPSLSLDRLPATSPRSPRHLPGERANVSSERVHGRVT